MTHPYPGTPQRNGSTGDAVRIIQEALNALGATSPPLVVDGNFGARTEAAVRNFQWQSGLNSDGVVGPLTWAELMRQWEIVTNPPPLCHFDYTVVSGDTLWRLSQRYGVTVDAIRDANGMTSDMLTVGMMLKIPCCGSVTPTPPTPPAPPTPPPIPSRTIVLDPGHGGSDSGAVQGSRMEKNDTLRMALAVQQILQSMGQKVVMTRTTDTFVTLADRSVISNENNADIFVSIHRNSSVNPNANGVENYVFTTAPSTNVLYAQTVLSHVVNAGVQNNNGVIRANFAVLRNTTAPAMLLELGYITNARDNELFDQNFNAYANAIANGILEALGGPTMPPPSYFFYTVLASDSLWSISQRFGTTVAAIRNLNHLTSDNLITNQVLKIPS
ncbi:MAG: N-acetylmuramoyl-L-alanine amidase [Defluviitaleaceae bacterium]|nr:N-acetylmuramoyl-L-alanine amidase [Defluviitaleaceae bacterium]